MVEVRFRESKADQGRKGAVLVRTRTGFGVGENGGDSGSVGRAFQHIRWKGVDRGSPPNGVRGSEGSRLWFRGQGTRYFRPAIEDLGGKWRDEGRGAGAKLIPEKNALHAGRIGGGTRLAAKRVPEAVIMKKRRWSSDVLMVHVRANMEDPAWV